ncbi:hypothetical protein BUALT_Bualt06G0046000 [Buddleja alternifolia]|uniref:BED-type domain-containing protein n=1 Tax=Buddleja alternifolia TaxID=168488 RepID=A0AAV6XJH3_9LAMI|nr:hypothetical protein BUALT_Bualt06G0046000 [Buddleja alternifolia]
MSDSESQYRGEFGGGQSFHSSSNIVDEQCQNVGAHPEEVSTENVNVNDVENNEEVERDEDDYPHLKKSTPTTADHRSPQPPVTTESSTTAAHCLTGAEMSDSESQYRGEFGGGQSFHSSSNLVDEQCQNVGAHPEEVSTENVNVNDVENNEEVERDEDDLPTSKKGKKRKISVRSTFWRHYVKFYCQIDKIQKARCKYCKRELKADPKSQGTSSLKTHYNCCKKRPPDPTIDANQTQLTFQTNAQGGKTSNLVK